MLKLQLRRPRFVCSLALCLMASACAGNPDMPSKARSAATGSDALLIAIKAEIGDAACDGPQQCHSIALGAKPCGGPEGYLAWSSKRSHEQRLTKLVEQHVAARKAENVRNDVLSTCVFETDPGVRCQAAHCTLGPRGLGSLPDEPR
ncbi:MAG: hypothetical protein H7335_12240 [Massilia sp.]|nr:hypothetical protein [Massilia sp.]